MDSGAEVKNDVLMDGEELDEFLEENLPKEKDELEEPAGKNQLEQLKDLRRLLPPPSDIFDDVLFLDGNEESELLNTPTKDNWYDTDSDTEPAEILRGGGTEQEDLTSSTQQGQEEGSETSQNTSRSNRK